MFGEITFDTVNDEVNQDHIEGCYRVGDIDWENWKVFYFTHWRGGERWTGGPVINRNGLWQSGITGIEVVLPNHACLNNTRVTEILSDILGVRTWSVVQGPDSLQLK